MTPRDPSSPPASAQESGNARSALVACRDAALTFGLGTRAVVAVHGASLSVQPSDRLAVVGPSGSGKSSLLHLLAGLERPTSGTVTWPALAEDARNEIGLVFQGDSLIPALDVAENTALPLVLAGRHQRQAREAALDALARVDAAALADRLPEELSGGQAQGVAVARVLAQAPRLILADEPTGRLDHATGAHVLTALLTAADTTGAALVITTHDPSVAARLSTRFTMRDGRVLTVGHRSPDRETDS
ncbi:ATP-binding cassette domain-containing protein [Streptomyces seoulensis]|uniref:ATP-binding cassette domain-containing protein n=1 Tax=Streptomyces seoulensis TaxID=73044 RepID=A0A4P6TPA2_STRSO|nr:ATP-binding cassette domain-containing protein [Streptomyces seoulensis]